MSQPGEPGYTLFSGARQHLQQMGPQSGLRSVQELDNAAGALALSAQKAGMSRIDHLLAGNDGRTLFAVQGALGDPAMLRASVDREQAAQQPLAQSSQGWLPMSPSRTRGRARPRAGAAFSIPVALDAGGQGACRRFTYDAWRPVAPTWKPLVRTPHANRYLECPVRCCPLQCIRAPPAATLAAVT